MICPIYFFSGRDDTSMRKRQFRFAGIILFALVIIPVSAFAGTIDDLLTQLSYPAEKPAEVTCRIEAVSIPQFSETRTGWLNGLLKHMSFRIRSDGIIQEEEIDVDDKPVIQCKTRETEGRTETLFPFDDRIYITEGTDLTELLTGISPEADMTEYYTEIRVLLPEFYRFFSGLPELFPDSVSESKVSIKYKGYGTAVKRYAMVLSQDVISDEKMNGYLENKELIHVRQFLSKVVLSGKQRLTLLRDEDGNLMKVNYTGKSGLAEDSIRNTDADWKCLKYGNNFKDELVLKTPALNGTERHNISLTRESVVQPDGTEEYTCNIDTDEVRNRVRNRTRLEISLKSADKTISGNAVKKTTSSGVNDIREYRISIAPGETEDYHGNLEIAHELNKIDREHFRVQFSWNACDAPYWKEGESAVPSEKDLQNIRVKAAGIFLRALEDIPEEDLQFILADLPDGWWKQTIKNTEKPEERETP